MLRQETQERQCRQTEFLVAIVPYQFEFQAQQKLREGREGRTTAPLTFDESTTSRRTLSAIPLIELSISVGTSLARTPRVSMTLARRVGSGKSSAVMSKGRSFMGGGVSFSNSTKRAGNVLWEVP